MIEMLSPSPITAGTGEELTITGNNFGNFDPLTCNGCRIKFADGDEYGFGEAYAQYTDIVSWTNEVITVKVPSVTNEGGFEHPASTGGVWVERPNESDPEIIERSNEKDIHIQYSVLNFREQIVPFIPTKRIAISNQTNNGIVFKYDATSPNAVPSDIRNLFKNAVTRWCQKTQVAWKISEDPPPTGTDINFNDGINLVTFRPQSEFQNPLARAAVVLGGHIRPCSNNLTPVYINDIDIKINNEYSSSNINHPSQWQNYILHELGHAHGLNHAQNPTIPSSEEYIMNALANNWGTGFHDIQLDDAEGANTCFAASQAILADPECVGIPPISIHECEDIANPVYEVPTFISDFYISPNPVVTNEINVHITSRKSKEVNISVINILGESVYKENTVIAEGDTDYKIIFEENLNVGLYYVSLQEGSKVVTQKFVKI